MMQYKKKRCYQNAMYKQQSEINAQFDYLLFKSLT